MRKVVDSNFLQSDELRQYLAKSPNNFAVLTDYAAMEAYKGNTLKSIFPSMKILSEYPNQIIVLKGTQIVCGLRGRKAGLQRRMIDDGQTRDFGKYCRDIRAAKQGDLSIQSQILRLGAKASDHMDKILADAVHLPKILDQISKAFTEAELRIIRKRDALPVETIDKLIHGVVLLAAHMLRAHPNVTKLPDLAELPNTYIFRFAFCAFIMLFRWISDGSAQNIRPEKMRNDKVDLSFATYALFFDGLLTADKKLDGIYKEAEYMLGMIVAPKIG